MSDQTSRPASASSDLVEVVGVFNAPSSCQRAVDELLSSGFDRADLGMLASHQPGWKARTKGKYDVRALEDDPTVPRAAYMGADSVIEGMTGLAAGVAYIAAMAAAGIIAASDGSLSAAYAGAAAAGALGGMIAAMAARRIGGRYGTEIRDQIRHGGILLWVAARDDDHRKRALRILDRHAAMDVHAHVTWAEAIPAANPFAGAVVDPFLPGARV